MPAIRPSVRLRASRRGLRAFAPAPANDRLMDLPAFRPNPGDLTARYYIPKGLRPGAPLVVVLHGCTQDAAVYDHGSGWSALADKHGFALLFPEQKRSNNVLLCFNWFAEEDNRRGQGEAASIWAMIEAMTEAHGIDPARIFVTGLSAGGAMAAAMLATYPEVFAAGAIIAGVAYGCASNVAEAFDCMNGPGRSSGGSPGGKVRRASRHAGPWPRVQVWHGSADHTVAPGNGDAIARQWADVHGLAPKPDRADRIAGYPRTMWLGPDGKVLIEHVVITGMAHGIPLDPGNGEGESGHAGAHMLDVGLSSTDHIAAFFGIAPAVAERAEKAPRGAAPSRERARAMRPPEPAHGVQAVIEKALKAAGLMR